MAREKEKQKATQKKPVILTPKKGVEAKVLVGRSVPEEKQIVTLSDEVDEKELEKIKETESKDSLNKMQAIMEARQKLNKFKPSSIGSAKRIDGVSPSDINVLLVYLKMKGLI